MPLHRTFGQMKARSFCQALLRCQRCPTDETPDLIAKLLRYGTQKMDRLRTPNAALRPRSLRRMDEPDRRVFTPTVRSRKTARQNVTNGSARPKTLTRRTVPSNGAKRVLFAMSLPTHTNRDRHRPSSSYLQRSRLHGHDPRPHR